MANINNTINNTINISKEKFKQLLQKAIERGKKSPRVQEVMKDFAEFGMTLFVLGAKADTRVIERVLSRNSKVLFLASDGFLTWNRLREVYHIYDYDGTQLLVVPYTPQSK